MPSIPSRSSTFSASSSSSAQQTLWNANEILQIEYDGRCVGWAYSKGRKCLNPINRDSKAVMKTLLHKLSSQPPDSDVLLEKLRCLAKYGLCKRFHQDQRDEMVEKWVERMQEAFPTDTATETSLPAQSEIETVLESIAEMQDQVTALQEHLRVAQRRRDQLVYASTRAPTSPALSRVPTIEIPAINLSWAPINHPSASAATGSPIVETAENATMALPSNACSSGHVRRRQLDGQCPICQDGLDLSELPLSEVLWCKSGCGKSVHRECQQTWIMGCWERDQEEDADVIPTCTLCRSEWGPSCWHDDQPPSNE